MPPEAATQFEPTTLVPDEFGADPGFMQDIGMDMAGVIIMVIIVDIQQGQQPVITMVQNHLLHPLHIPGPHTVVQTYTGIVKPG